MKFWKNISESRIVESPTFTTNIKALECQGRRQRTILCVVGCFRRCSVSKIATARLYGLRDRDCELYEKSSSRPTKYSTRHSFLLLPPTDSLCLSHLLLLMSVTLREWEKEKFEGKSLRNPSAVTFSQRLRFRFAIYSALQAQFRYLY